MGESDEKSSEATGEKNTQRAAAGTGRRATLWLVVGIAMASAALGFFSSARRPDSSRKVVPPFVEESTTLEAPEPALPASPLDFLISRMSERSATVGTLFEEARRVTECLVSGFPDDPGVYDMAARVHNKRGDWQEAARQWELALEENAGYRHAYLGLATLAAQEGENERAVSLLRQALIIAPDSFDTQIQLAQVLVDSNRMEEAIRLLEKNVTADPRVYRGYVLLGMAHMQRGEYQEAKESYEAAIAAHPQHANAHFGLATACGRLGQQELQQEYLAKFQVLRTEEREIASGQRHQFDDLDSMCADIALIYIDAARICLAQERPQEAEILCHRAAALDPRNTDCRQALAWMYIERGMHADVIQMFEQLKQIEPGNLGYPLEIARVYGEMGHWRAAEETLRKVCAQAPENAVGYVALASFLLDRKLGLQEAVEMAQTAARLAPNASNYVLLSTAYERSNEIPKAVEAMSKAVELAPDSLQYQQMYELLKEKQGE